MHKFPTSVACCNQIHHCLLSKNSFRIGLFDEKSVGKFAQSELCDIALKIGDRKPGVSLTQRNQFYRNSELYAQSKDLEALPQTPVKGLFPKSPFTILKSFKKEGFLFMQHRTIRIVRCCMKNEV